MRFLIDTNIFLHAANSASPHHKAARDFLQRHLRARSGWCVTWPILYEFLRVSTHRRVFPKPLTANEALQFMAAFMGLEEVAILSATDRHFTVLTAIVDEIGPAAVGNLFHDLHTAALMREHGVPEIITADTDFFNSLSYGYPIPSRSVDPRF
jgi:toxin-antitoxin system PIN domain toxin